MQWGWWGLLGTSAVCHLDKVTSPTQPTSIVGVLGFEKEARMMSPVTSHTVQLPSGMAVKRVGEETQWNGIYLSNNFAVLAGGWMMGQMVICDESGHILMGVVTL